MDIEKIAEIAHEVNRAFCIAMGDDSQRPWHSAPEAIKSSAVDGVMFLEARPFCSPNALHENWMGFKIADGWTHGPKKDDEAKTHPGLVPFEQLPFVQQAKDHIFQAVARELLKVREEHLKRMEDFRTIVNEFRKVKEEHLEQINSLKEINARLTEME